MAYITYEDYEEYGFPFVERGEFESLIKRASDEVDKETKFFYVNKDIETDHPIRRENFKKAVAAQVAHFDELGATTSTGVNAPQTVTMGRTSMTTGSRGGSGGAETVSILSPDARSYLESVGLMYRGLRRTRL